MRAEGFVGDEAGGRGTQQVGEGGGDDGERRLPPPLQHLRKLVLTERQLVINKEQSYMIDS